MKRGSTTGIRSHRAARFAVSALLSLTVLLGAPSLAQAYGAELPAESGAGMMRTDAATDGLPAPTEPTADMDSHLTQYESSADGSPYDFALHEIEDLDVPSIHNEDERDVFSVQAELPSRYQSPYVTGVRDQSPFGSCGAHGTIGALEANMVKKGFGDGSLDLSEWHVLAFAGGKDDIVDPLGFSTGNFTKRSPCDYSYTSSQRVCFSMASWVGPVDESLLPYDFAAQTFVDEVHDKESFFSVLEELNPWSDMAQNNDVAHLSGYVATQADDIDSVKRLVWDYGAAAMNMRIGPIYERSSNNNFYNEDTNAYCCDDTSMTDIDHMVTVVGWDDDYPRDNFEAGHRPSADGAWRVKNSWGEQLHDNGYFWLSYYDVALEAGADVCALDAENVNKHDHIYQHDGFNNLTNASRAIDSGTQVANVWETPGGSGGEVLDAVSFTLWDTNVDYSIQVYTGLEDASDPTSGTPMLASPQTGTTTYAGLYKVDLDDPVDLAPGTKFSVVIAVSKPSGNQIKFCFAKSYVYKTEGNYFGTRTIVSENYVLDGGSGESFWTYGSRWYDFYDRFKCVYRIKAYTCDEGEIVDQEVTCDDCTVLEGTSLALDAKTTGDGELSYRSQDEDVATVSATGVVRGLHVGTATIEITARGTRRYRNATKTVTVQVIPENGWVTFASGAKGYARGGALVTGWMDLGSSKYWFDGDGRMATGWTDVESGGRTMHYYFNPASGNLVRGTWFEIGGRKYYFRESGNMATGWATISDGGVDKKYYFEGDGSLVAGCWRDIDTGQGYVAHYYFRPSGAMATGWATIDGESYFFRPSGNMATGFADVPGDPYKRYFDADGRMLIGWQQIGGRTYYFRPSGAMQTGRATIGGVDYEFSESGTLRTPAS